MARTFVQQSQISGSLAFDDTMAAGSGLAGKQTIVGDLDALRSQINKIIGGERWYDALSGSQDLADIYAALHVDGSKANLQGALDVAGVADFDSAVFMAAALSVSGTLDVAQAATLANGLTVNGAAADFNADVTANKISIDGDVGGRLYIVDSDGSIKDESELTYDGDKLGIAGGLDVSAVADFGGDVFMDAALGVSGSLAVAGVADFAADVYMAAALGVSGSLTVAGPATMNDGLTVSGDRLEVTGSMGITGAVDFDSTLNVDGVADFKADVYMAAALGVSGSASVAGALDADSLEIAGLSDLNGALEVAGVADFASDVYMAAALGVSGSLTVAQAATFGGGLTVNTAAADFNADVTANKISIDGDAAMHLYIVDADGSIKDEAALWFDGAKLYVTGALEVSSDAYVGGDLTVAGNDIKDSADATVVTFKTINSIASSVEIANNMEVKGAMLYAVSASFSGDVTVQGDLTIQGSMTYIDTENLKVKDALIHLNTGGNSNLSPRGLVLHGDQAYDDLAFGAKPASGDFVLAKEVSDADVDAGNSDVFANAKLAAMWMSEIKLGGTEGSLSGSFVATAAGAELSSTAALSVAAADDMTLGAYGEEIGLMSAAEYTEFDGNFDATTIVGALNELFDMIGGGSAAKGDLTVAAVAGNTLTFGPAIGTLTAAEHKLVDVYLNGVLLSPSRDLSNLTTTAVDLDSAIASGLMADDVITVVIRSAV